MKGADLQDVAAQLGHADLRMTNRYAHLSPAHMLAAVKKTDGVFRGVNEFFLPAPKRTGHDEVTMEHENSAKLQQTPASIKSAKHPASTGVCLTSAKCSKQRQIRLKRPSLAITVCNDFRDNALI